MKLRGASRTESGKKGCGAGAMGPASIVLSSVSVIHLPRAVDARMIDLKIH